MAAYIPDCVGCGREGAYTILLATMPEGDGTRYYLPNQIAREEHGSGIDPVRQVAFCKSCMRTIEDKFRESIARLQNNNDQPPAKFDR